MNTETTSLSDLMTRAYNLSLDLSFKTKTWKGNYFDAREQFPLGGDADKIFGWSDGLFHKLYMNMEEGKCSIKAMTDFDIERFENQVIADIKEFEHLLKIYGQPLILSKEHMRARGYRGELAGYTKEEENQYNISRYKQLLSDAHDSLVLAKGYDEEYHYGREIVYYEKRLCEVTEQE